nr:EOG090X08WK [Triops cancriformis]
MEDLNELLQFLAKDTRLDLKLIAVQHLLGLTGTAEGRRTLLQNSSIIEALINLVDDVSKLVSKDTCLTLVNLSSTQDDVNKLLKVDKFPVLIEKLLKIVVDPEAEHADAACMALSNVSRIKAASEITFEQLKSGDPTVDQLVSIFCQEKYNTKGAKLHYLGPVFSNLSQIPEMRRYLLDRERCIFQRLIPFTDYQEAITRRGGIIGTIRNCCFDEEYHEWLLGQEVDLLPRLLLPLAGPEEISDEETEKLPIDLQYLSPDKERESDPDIRLLLLEAINQFCATKSGRETLREKNTYVILRELHKWEKDRAVLLACENVVNILLQYEHEIGQDNLKAVDVPEDLRDKFTAADEAYLKDCDELEKPEDVAR